MVELVYGHLSTNEYKSAISDLPTLHKGGTRRRAKNGRKGRGADPTALIINSVAGNILVFDRDYAGALERYRKTLEMDPGFGFAHVMLYNLYLLQQKYTEAAAELEKTGSTPGPFLLGGRAVIDALTGRRGEALRAVRELEEQSRRSYIPPTVPAAIWVALGNKDKAFPLLQKGCAERDAGLLVVKVAPFFDGIRSDARFKALLQCMNLD